MSMRHPAWASLAALVLLYALSGALWGCRRASETLTPEPKQYDNAPPVDGQAAADEAPGASRAAAESGIGRVFSEAPMRPDGRDASSTTAQTNRVGPRTGDLKAAADASRARLPDSNGPRSSAREILQDSMEVVERFDDGSLRRRWHARLYVNFDRAKTWQEQAAGSWVRHGLYEEFYPTGQRLVRGQFVEGKREGTWSYWHPTGRKAKEGAYRASQLNGDWEYYRKDGTLLRIERYAAQRPHGAWEHYATDGKTLLRREKHAEGIPHGRWTSWYPSGQKRQETHFVGGELHGRARTWHENGQLATEVHFREGIRHGMFQKWDTDGKLIASASYVHGREEFKANGQ